MNPIKIKRNCYIKPRKCPDCGKLCIFARSYLSERCRPCAKARGRRNKRIRRREQGLPARKYTRAYFRRREQVILRHPYCSLCGSKDCLTCHHIGGGESIYKLTVLCDECHQAYEAYKNRKEAGCLNKIMTTIGYVPASKRKLRGLKILKKWLLT